jgi:hypothetical protein
VSRRLTTEEFVAKARQAHGERYDYAQTVYRNSGTPVIIICRLHGAFSQIPYNHLGGRNCKQCGIETQGSKRRLATEQFVARARKKHGDRFDYSGSVYRTSDTPVTIVCRIHGEFHQTPENHLAGKGCKYCAKNQHPSADQIILRFRAIHGNNYEYALSTFQSTKQRLQVTCRFHGPFTISFYRHLKGTGCPECTHHYNQKAAQYFAKRATKVHGKKYSYTTYKPAPSKMRIVCAAHGVFTQSAASHLKGHGCPGCANDRKRLLAKGGYSEGFFVLHPDMSQRPATLYVVEFSRPGESFVKAGITRTSVASRFKGGYQKYARRLITSRSLCLYEAFCLEQRILTAFKKFQQFPEQKNFVGKTECLSSSCAGEVESWLEEHTTEAKPSNSVL